MTLKRHPALQDYSREHHDELLLIWKIREGFKKNISTKRIADYCIHHYNEFTLFHMANEEKYILTKLPDADNDKIKILSDHVIIKELINKLSDNNSANDGTLIEFAGKMEEHIRFEERTFFPKLQNNFSDEIVRSMQFAAKNIEDSKEWKDEFWKN